MMLSKIAMLSSYGKQVIQMKMLKAAISFTLAIYAISAISADKSVGPINIVSHGEAPLTMLRSVPGPIAKSISTYPSYIEFQRNNQSIKGSMGALGSFEMNMSVNMDYADGTHRLYDKTKNAYWLALNTKGLYMQHAPAMDTKGDVWNESGKKYAFILSNEEATFRGDIKPMENGRSSLGTKDRRFDSLHIDDGKADRPGSATIHKSAGRVVVAAGESRLIVTSRFARPESHIFSNVATFGSSAHNAQITPMTGKFEVTLDKVADRDTSVDFFIVN